MVNCMDCIHEEICDMPIITYGRKNASNCKKFKNKADFVEVCHCHECRHCEVYISNGGIYSYQCVRTIEWVKANHFCSYGERVTDTNVGSK